MTKLSKDWKSKLDAAQKVEKPWRDSAQKIVSIYRGSLTAKGSSSNQRRFNILYANVSILLPAVYQKAPTADIRRKFTEENELATRAASVMQKAIKTVLDNTDINSTAKAAIQDQMLPGRGVIRIRYEPILKEIEAVNEQGETTLQDVKVWESVEPEHVYWENITYEPRRRWEDVNWIAFRHLFTKKEMLETFGDKFKGLDKRTSQYQSLFKWTEADQGEGNSRNDDLDNIEKKALFWEIWDKDARKLIWFCPDMTDGILRVDDDPLELESFYPIAKPLFGITTTDSLIPVPEYTIYQDLAEEIESITQRISQLVTQVKVRGAYSALETELADILDAENKLIPVKNMSPEADLSKQFWIVPIDQVVQAIRELYVARQETKSALYEVTGISDILRGASVANETATAQRIKGNYGTLRINDRRATVDEMIKGVVNLIGECVAQHFSAKTLQLMTGEEIDEELLDFLRSDFMRLCHLDIETDSTIASDETAEQEAVAKLMGALVSFFKEIWPAVKSGDMPKDMAFELLRIAIRPFKGARKIEELITQYMNKAEQENPQGGQQQPNPQQQAQQIQQQMQQQQMQIDQTKQQGEMKQVQIDGQIAQGKGEVEKMKIQTEAMKQQAAQQII